MYNNVNRLVQGSVDKETVKVNTLCLIQSVLFLDLRIGVLKEGDGFKVVCFPDRNDAVKNGGYGQLLAMAAAAQNTNNTTIRLILLAKKLTASLDQTLQTAVHDTYEVLFDAQNEVAYLMLGSMSLELQRTLENYKAYDMIQELKTIFEEQAKQELFETVKAFHACKHEDGQSVGTYILKMKSYLDTLERIGYAMR
ncbi:hypothetical protein Tco_0667311 [Tanacetum coccineum]